MDNQAAEIHDMRLKAIRLEETSVVVELSAFIHSTSGTPGFDPGVGWYQAAELHISAGVVGQTPSPITLWVLDGSIEVAGTDHDNLLPLPFHLNGATRLRFEGHEGVLEITGTGVELVLTGARGREEKFR